MMHNNAKTSENIKAVTKHPRVFTCKRFKRKIPTQKNPVKLLPQKTQMIHFCNQKEIN